MGFKIDIPTAKDSFRKLAMNPPELLGPSAYFLTMYEYDMENPRYIRTAEGTFRILVNERFLCQLMLECAEEYLKIWIDACSKEDIGVYGAEIKRLPAGKEIPVDVFDPQRPLQWWIYDHKGSLIDRSLVSSYHWHKGLAGCFLGRDNARFRPGDIVEFLSIDRALHKLSAELGIVYSAPLLLNSPADGIRTVMENLT